MPIYATPERKTAKTSLLEAHESMRRRFDGASIAWTTPSDSFLANLHDGDKGSPTFGFDRRQ